jgi:hypothetical protein
MPTPNATYDTVINITPGIVPSATQNRLSAGLTDDVLQTIKIPSKERCQLEYNFAPELNYTYAQQGFALYIFSDPRRLNLVTTLEGTKITDGEEPDIELRKVYFQIDMADLQPGHTYYCVMRQISPATLGVDKVIVWHSFIIHVDRFG